MRARTAYRWYCLLAVELVWIYYVLYQLEMEKNRLEMLLNNNLLKKLERLQQDLMEMKAEDRKHKLENLELELKSVIDRLTSVNSQFSELERNIETMSREQRKVAKELDEAKKDERSVQERIDEEAKELEKMSNKQSILTKNGTSAHARSVSWGHCLVMHLINFRALE